MAITFCRTEGKWRAPTGTYS